MQKRISVDSQQYNKVRCATVEPEQGGVQRVRYRSSDIRDTGLAYRITKRGLDITISTLVILLTWPLILFISIYIKKTSSGSSIFRQTRIKKNRRKDETPRHYYAKLTESYMPRGRNGSNGQGAESGLQDEKRMRLNSGAYYYCFRDNLIKKCRRKKDLLGTPFTFYKFSTMCPNARKRFPHMYEYRYTKEEIQRLNFKVKNDPRVPKWAEWLRKTSLDELPNFINVLLGDMSVVGPRPDIPEMVKYYSDNQRVKLEVKPGITGLSQIRGRGNLNFQDTLKFDMEYVENMSLWLDLKIIAMTIVATIRRDGAF